MSDISIDDEVANLWKSEYEKLSKQLDKYRNENNGLKQKNRTLTLDINKQQITIINLKEENKELQKELKELTKSSNYWFDKMKETEAKYYKTELEKEIITKKSKTNEEKEENEMKESHFCGNPNCCQLQKERLKNINELLLNNTESVMKANLKLEQVLNNDTLVKQNSLLNCKINELSNEINILKSNENLRKRISKKSKSNKDLLLSKSSKKKKKEQILDLKKRNNKLSKMLHKLEKDFVVTNRNDRKFINLAKQTRFIQNNIVKEIESIGKRQVRKDRYSRMSEPSLSSRKAWK